MAEEFEKNAYGLCVPRIGFELTAELEARWIASRIACSKTFRHSSAASGAQPAGHSKRKTGAAGEGCPRSQASSGWERVSRPVGVFAAARTEARIASLASVPRPV